MQFHSTPCFFTEEGLGAQTAQGLAFGPCVLKPTNTATLTLRSPNPAVAPRIQHNYLGSEEDRASIVAGLRIALDIALQPSMKDVITGEHVVRSADPAPVWTSLHVCGGGAGWWWPGHSDPARRPDGQAGGAGPAAHSDARAARVERLLRPEGHDRGAREHHARPKGKP